MADFSMFQDVPGLLTPEQQQNVNTMALLNGGAALLKSGGTFRPYKGGALADVGNGVQGLLSGYTTGTDQALKQQLLRQQIMSGQLGMAQTIALYHALGLPLPTIPGMAATPGSTPGVQSSAPTPGAVPAAPPSTPGGGGPPGLLTPPGGQPTQASAAPTADPGRGGIVVPTPDGSGFTRVPGPSAPPPGPPQGPSAIGTVQSLPLGDRAVLATGGPAAVSKVVGDIAAKNAELTPEQKNARASGYRSPFDYTVGVSNAQATPEMKNAAAAGSGNPLQFEYDKGQVAPNVKKFNDIQDQATKSLDERDDLNVVKQSILDPSFYSGLGSERNLALKQAYGVYAHKMNDLTGAKPGDKNYRDPTQPVAQEQFNAASNQVLMSYLKSSFAGQRITNRDVKLVEQIVPNNDHSPEGNLTRTMIMDKLAARRQQVGDLASTYAKAHGGHLDQDWDPTLRQWWNDPQNALFKPGELQLMKAGAAAQIAQARAGGATIPAPHAAPPAATLPPAAVGALKLGVHTTFKNGTTWTLGPNGQPQQVQ